mmetsp:Transcript_1697/g.2239  ORF Transcript_1697/g.2239 Transcript_1697/m.2239 type:complete len:103 (+) Transcript_1697:77-385(+)
MNEDEGIVILKRLRNIGDQIFGAPRVVESLGLGLLSSAAVFVHVLNTSIFHSPKAPLRNRLLRALDAGIITFCCSSCISWYLTPSSGSGMQKEKDEVQRRNE